MRAEVIDRLRAHAAHLRELAARYSWKGNAKYPPNVHSMRPAIEQQAADIEAVVAELSGNPIDVMRPYMQSIADELNLTIDENAMAEARAYCEELVPTKGDQS